MTQSFISCELLLSFGFGSCCILSAGGMKTREDNDEELQNDQRRSRVWKLLRRVNSADLLPLLSSIGCHAMSPSTFCEQLMDGMRIWRTASGRAACSGYRPGLCFVRFRKIFSLGFSWCRCRTVPYFMTLEAGLYRSVSLASVPARRWSPLTS